MAQISDYTSLITSEHQTAARFMATVAGVMQPFVDIRAVEADFAAYYDLDNAIGVQLDAVGLWVGVSRYVNIAVNQYFSWDTQGAGWNQGSWFQVGDVLSNVTTLGDDDYRLLIRAKIACNSWDGSLPAAHTILKNLFAGDNVAIAMAESSMAVAITIMGDLSNIARALLVGGYVPLKPIGVSVTYSFVSSADALHAPLGQFVLGANTLGVPSA